MSSKIRSPQFALGRYQSKPQPPQETEAERNRRQWREWLRERDERDAMSFEDDDYEDFD